MKGLVIDAGGVLIRSVGYAARRAWEARRGHPDGFLDRILDEAIGPGWAGGRTEGQIEAELVRLSGATDLDELRDVLGAHEELEPQVAALVLRLRPHVRTAVLCNAGPDRRSVLVDRFGVDRLVDLIVVSAEEGMSKPDPRIYRLTAERLGVAPADCVMVDDVAANVAGAEAAGMIGVLFEGADALEATLSAREWGRGLFA